MTSILFCPLSFPSCMKSPLDFPNLVLPFNDKLLEIVHFSSLFLYLLNLAFPILTANWSILVPPKVAISGFRSIENVCILFQSLSKTLRKKLFSTHLAPLLNIPQNCLVAHCSSHQGRSSQSPLSWIFFQNFLSPPHISSLSSDKLATVDTDLLFSFSIYPVLG